MTNKELNEVANKVWDDFANQMPEEFTGRDLLKIATSFAMNTADALDMKPTAVCMMMYKTLNDERHSVKVVKSIKRALFFAGIVAMIIGASCGIWFDYKLGSKAFDFGTICILAWWALEFVWLKEEL